VKPIHRHAARRSTIEDIVAAGDSMNLRSRLSGYLLRIHTQPIIHSNASNRLRGNAKNVQKSCMATFRNIGVPVQLKSL